MRGSAMMVLVACVLAACSDSTGSRIQQRNETDLVFLRAAADAPPLAALTASFWAVRGEDSELRMFFRPRPGEADSTEFLRFKVSNSTALTLPGGIAVPLGDSVLITVLVVDPARFIVDFQPSGLLFRNEPAELRMRYDEADDDLDDDGDVDAEDDDIEQRLRIWRQERLGDPWFQVTGVVSASLDEVEAEITGFTRYAIAY